MASTSRTRRSTHASAPIAHTGTWAWLSPSPAGFAAGAPGHELPKIDHALLQELVRLRRQRRAERERIRDEYFALRASR
jgi:hypothetical protein